MSNFKTVYSFHPITKLYTGLAQADASPLDLDAKKAALLSAASEPLILARGTAIDSARAAFDVALARGQQDLERSIADVDSVASDELAAAELLHEQAIELALQIEQPDMRDQAIAEAVAAHQAAMDESKAKADDTRKAAQDAFAATSDVAQRAYSDAYQLAIQAYQNDIAAARAEIDSSTLPDVWMLPAHTTEADPGEIPAGQQARYIGDDVWVLEDIPGPPEPEPLTLDQARAAAAARISQGAAESITGGFVSSALGSPHSYPTSRDWQSNLSSSVLSGQVHKDEAGWTTLFPCTDAAGQWAYREHTAAQIMQVGSEFKDHVINVLAVIKVAKDALVNAPDATVAELASINW
jgi:hypothetical protein